MALEYFERGQSVYVWDPESQGERQWAPGSGWSDTNRVSKFLILGEGELDNLSQTDARRIVGADLDQWRDDACAQDLAEAAEARSEAVRRIPALAKLGDAAVREAEQLGF